LGKTQIGGKKRIKKAKKKITLGEEGKVCLKFTPKRWGNHSPKVVIEIGICSKNICIICGKNKSVGGQHISRGKRAILLKREGIFQRRGGEGAGRTVYRWRQKQRGQLQKERGKADPEKRGTKLRKFSNRKGFCGLYEANYFALNLDRD